jgi:hypothetical protein
MRRKHRLDTASAKPRMYQNLWEMIAKNTSDKPVKVRCPVGNQPRLIQAVKKEKSAANVLRKSVDAVSYGELIIHCDGEWVYFSLKYNGDMI